jgi:hypothetical protein
MPYAMPHEWIKSSLINDPECVMTFGTISHGHGALTPADTRFVCSLYWGMRLTKAQLMLLSQYFSDVSKILFGSTVIGYFIPSSAGLITLPVFFAGVIVGLVCFLISLDLARESPTL